MNIRRRAGAVHRSAGSTGVRKRQLIGELQDLHHRIVRIRRLVTDGGDTLDIVDQAEEVQARLRQVALWIVADRMRSSLSAMSIPDKQSGKLVSEVIDALSGTHRIRR